MAARKPPARTVGDAVEALPVGADRAAWLAQRRLGIGGSDVSAIFGLSRFDTARGVYLDKIGARDELPGSWPMTRGTLLEPGLIAWFTDQTGLEVTAFGTLRNPTYPWMQYNPDGIVLSEDGIVECKTTAFWGRTDWADGQTADHAELQVHAGMAVTGFDHAHVIVAIGDADPEIRLVERDPAVINLVTSVTKQFWHENVLARVEPPVTYIDLAAVREALPEIKPGTPVVGGTAADEAVKRRQHAAQVIKDYQQIKDAADAEILLALGAGSHLVIDGEVAASRSSYERAGYAVKPTTVSRLTVPTNRKPYKAGI